MRRLITIQSSDEKQTKGYTLDEIPFCIYHTTKDNFYYELFKHTGNKDHVEKILSKLNKENDFASEEAIYKKAGLNYVMPEMREDVAEWNFNNNNG